MGNGAPRALKALFAAALFCAGACTQQEDAHAQLMVIIDSDVAVRSGAQPSGELERVAVEVANDGVVLMNQEWSSPTTTLTFPQTVALVNLATKPSDVLRVTLRGYRDRVTTFVHERQVQVPGQGTQALVMGFEWLCRGFARGPDHRPESGCPEGQTCRAGSCQSAVITAADLSPWPVASPSCFDVHACASGGQDITSKLDINCAYALSEAESANAATLNVALETLPGQGGVCGSTPEAPCLVSLPASAGAGSSIAGGRLQLPQRVCQLLSTGEMIARVWLSSACPSRLPTQPVCSAWLTPPPAAGG